MNVSFYLLFSFQGECIHFFSIIVPMTGFLDLLPGLSQHLEDWGKNTSSRLCFACLQFPKFEIKLRKVSHCLS